MIYRKGVRAVMLASIILVLAVGLAVAQGSWPPGPWNVPFIIQNMGSSTATIQAAFYSSAGSLVHTESGSAGPGDTFTVRPHQISDANLPVGQYSVVVSADQAVASIANVYTASGRLMAYGASSPTSSTLYFPNFNKNYYGWNTPVYIQNAGSSATTVGLEFLPVTGGSAYNMTTTSILPGAAYVFDPTDQAGLSDGAYSLKATATDTSVNLAGTLAQLLDTAGQEMAVNAFTSGAETLYCPNINRNYGAENWTTPVVIQNLGSSAVTPTVYYYAVNVSGYSSGDLVNSWTLASIGPGESIPERPHARSDSDLPVGIYSMKITGGSGSQLAAIVNQVSQSGTGGAMAYGAFATGGTEVFLPNINRNYGAEGWTTPFLIQNVGTATADVKVEYIQGGAVVKTVTSSEDPTLSIVPGGASAQRPHTLSGLADGKYSVKITSQGSSPPPLVAIVNQVGSVPGASAVEGISQ